MGWEILAASRVAPAIRGVHQIRDFRISWHDCVMVLPEGGVMKNVAQRVAGGYGKRPWEIPHGELYIQFEKANYLRQIGLTHAEIGARFGVSAHTVARRLMYGSHMAKEHAAKIGHERAFVALGPDAATMLAYARLLSGSKYAVQTPDRFVCLANSS